MKLTATDAAFLHLCSNAAANPWLLRDPAARSGFQAVLQAGLPCEDARMAMLKWAFMAFWKAGGYEPGDDPAAAQALNGGAVFLDAFAEFSERAAEANSARAAAIMTQFFSRGAS